MQRALGVRENDTKPERTGYENTRYFLNTVSETGNTLEMYYLIQFSQLFHKVGALIIPILHTRKIRGGNVKKMAMSHIFMKQVFGVRQFDPTDHTFKECFRIYTAVILIKMLLNAQLILKN